MGRDKEWCCPGGGDPIPGSDDDDIDIPMLTKNLIISISPGQTIGLDMIEEGDINHYEIIDADTVDQALDQIKGFFEVLLQLVREGKFDAKAEIIFDKLNGE